MRPFALVAATLLGTATLAACDHRMPADPDAEPRQQTSGTLPECGFENGGACLVAPRCDRGLAVDDRGTPLNLADDICVNDTRHVVGTQFRGTWADWALANQRTLALDEPYSWTMQIVTHNANNNVADGEIGDPNQIWSLSDQLDLGARGLWLDLHWVFGDVRLCHAYVVDVGPEFHINCTALDRPFAYAAREIAGWLAANPGEIVFLDLEHYLEGNHATVNAALDRYFGDRLLRSASGEQTGSWPSRRELRAMGKQVIVGVLGSHGFGPRVHRDHQPATLGIRSVIDFEVSRTAGIVTACRSTFDTDFTELKDVVSYGDHHRFRLIGEDRTILSNAQYGLTSASDVADQAACNIKFISLDMLGAARFTGPAAWRPRAPTEERQPSAVWSWRVNDRGQGDAALLQGSTGRWRSAGEQEEHRFACGRIRSETTREHTQWPDRLGVEWRITTRSGPWREGGRACLEEFGDEGFVFSVPVNGYSNGQLRLADASRGDVWLNYDSMESDWRINQRPRANAGVDRTVECTEHHGTPVQLDASASFDPEQHTLSYEWGGPFGTATGVNPTVPLPVGVHTITLLVEDAFGGVAADAVVIEIVDTTPPEVRSVTATPDTLWPPSHVMRPVVVEVDVTDLCDPDPACRIVSVTSNEPVNAKGDGNTTPDWRITGALTLELRAERAGPADGRVYTIAIECTDASGNAASTAVFVTVPHDRRPGPP